MAASYYCEVSTGHKLVFEGKDGKKNSPRVLPCEDCFARAAGKKATPCINAGPVMLPDQLNVMALSIRAA